MVYLLLYSFVGVEVRVPDHAWIDWIEIMMM